MKTSIVLGALLAITGCAPPGPAATFEGAASTEGASLDDDAPLGANLETGGAVFRVWAPDVTRAQVTGSFVGSPVDLIARNDGTFEAHVPGVHAGDTYDFQLDSLTRFDPWCRQLSGASCVVVDPSAYTWQTPTFTRPDKNSEVVYELHVGSYAVPSGAQYGTFASLADALPSIADLGVNVVELMPIQSFGSGPNTWGYNPQLWFAPKPSYGTADELRALVDRAHGLGMAVWMDSVINHTDSWNNAPLTCFDAPCASGTAGLYFFPAGDYAMTPWGPRPDYADSNVGHMLLSSARWWIDEMHGDGFRWDSVSNIRALDGVGTVPSGRDILVAINGIAHGRGAQSVAEDLKGDSDITTPSASGGFGFDSQWDGFGYTVATELTKLDDDTRDLGALVGALTGSSDDPYSRVLFTEDHDTVGNGSTRIPDRIDSADPTSYLARKLSMLAATLLFTAPGVPMIFQGQENLATGTFANPPAPNPAPTTRGSEVRAFYKDLIGMRRNFGSTTGSLLDDDIEVFHRNDERKVLAYRRYGASGEDVIVIVNLANTSFAEYDIGVDSRGPWTIRMNLDDPKYGDDFTSGQTGTLTAIAQPKDGKAYTLPLQLGDYSAIVLSR